MSYVIKYDSGTTRKYPEHKAISLKRRKKLILAGVICITVLILLHISSVRRLLLPGDPVVTERAIVKMVAELQAGEGVQEAVAAFCQEVIQSGLPD